MSDINHLGNCERATTINNEDVVLTDSEGKRLKISKADLAEVIRQVMPVATSEKNGLMGHEYAETSHSVETGGSIILGYGIYLIRTSFFGLSAILVVSGNGPTFLAKDNYYVDYTRIEQIDSVKCKLTNLYPITVTLYVTRLAL